ncbi:MAG: hypothetical protein ACK5TH_25740 [Prosthecobacter sp.]|jgi:hypothetical protein
MKQIMNRVGLLIGVVATLLGSAQFYARSGAVEFGKAMSAAINEVGWTSFKDTRQLVEFMNAELADEEEQAGDWDLLSFGYTKRIKALKEGMVYLTLQAGLPEKERFAKVPDLTPLRMQAEGQNDEALVQITLKLLVEYQSGL